MRETLFRAKGLDNGEWLVGDLITYETGETAILKEKFSKYGCEATEISNRRKVDPETVCQYTGLTDKNGQKIFEGDIIKELFLFGMSINVVATFKDGSFGVKWFRGSIKEFSPFSCFYNVTFEVIGNIFDNPELMEGGEADETD